MEERREDGGCENVMKMSEPNNIVNEMSYQESLHGKYEVWRGEDVVESVEKE